MAVLLPSLPLDVVARGLALAPDAAATSLLAVTTVGPRPRIVAASAAARNAGVQRNQLVSAALALAPGITLVERDSAREQSALADLATFVLGFTPHTALAPPCALVADIAASLRLFHGFERLVNAVTAGIVERGYRARLAFAPTPGAALAFARSGQPAPVRNSAQMMALLATLPLTQCDVDAHVRTLLQGVGVTTFGAACALPRAELARRCGPAFIDLLDRLRGHVADTRTPYQPPPLFCTRLPLPVPVHDVAALNFVARRATRDLADWLLARGLGVLRFELTLAHERYTHRRTGIPATVVTLALGGATRTLAHLDSVLRERLARVVVPAPVEAITLATLETAPLAGHTFGMLPGDAIAQAGAPLLDRLRARLGDDSVTIVSAHAEHRPELAVRALPAGTAATPPAVVRTPARRRAAGVPLDTAGLTPRTRIKPAADASTPQHAPVLPRPLWLLPQPAPLGSRPEHAHWLQRHDAERIESGWWDGHGVRRDYYRVTGAAGERLWVYRTHRRGLDDGDWFIQGLFA